MHLIGEHNGQYVIFPSEEIASDMRPPNTYEFSNPSIGQRDPSPLQRFQVSMASHFFPIDIMHLLGHGIAKQVWKMIQGVYGKESNNPLYLPPAARNAIGKQIVASNQTTPTSFAGSCGDKTRKLATVVQWIGSTLFVLYCPP